MSRTLWSLLAALTLVACSSTRSESRRAGEAPPPSAPAPQAGAAAPGARAPVLEGAPEQRAPQGPSEEQAALTRIQARLDEATRELQTARSEVAGSEQDLQRARQQADAAGRSDDALVRARAAEAVNAAQDRYRVAGAHAAYAQQLVAARNADVDAARARLQAADVQRTPANDPSRSERIAEATRAEDSARARALELGKKALAAERQWHMLAQAASRAPASAAAAATPPASAMGTGSGATDSPGAPGTTTAPPAPPQPAPRP